MNRKDLKELGLKDGDTVKITNADGKLDPGEGKTFPPRSGRLRHSAPTFPCMEAEHPDPMGSARGESQSRKGSKLKRLRVWNPPSLSFW